ncbi:MAG: ABC transporter permease [Bradyrhizobiaceae bacterium]|nr:MAG: ABC transporter permease [Bradyrhizobiaceae bacterium]
MIDILRVFKNEFRRIFALRPAFAVLVVGTLIYAVFYPQPYVNEALRNAPIAVVDLDGTWSSRELARRIDATPDIAVSGSLPDFPSAEREVFARNVSGILVIPVNFERDLLHGRPSPIALYADASYFLVYQRIAGGVTAVARTLGAEVETARLIAVGTDPVIAEAVADPMPLTTVPLFNPQGGYATYILPAAFVLILQQTLLIGTAVLGTIPAGEVIAGPAITVLGKLLAYLVLQALILPFYLIVLPYLYGIPRLGSVTTILAFGLPFVLAVSALGMVVAGIFKKPLTVQLVLAAVGIPFLFLAGFSWPAEAIPEIVKIPALLLPSSSAINGLVRVGQLGASLSDVRHQYLTLWGLALAYGVIAMIIEARRRSSVRPLPSGDLPQPAG